MVWRLIIFCLFSIRGITATGDLCDNTIQELQTRILELETELSQCKPSRKEKKPFKKTNTKPIELTDSSFKTELKSLEEFPVFVLFYAEWCGHCKAIKPHWNKLAKHFNDGNVMRIAQLEADQNRKMAEKFKIKGFPTLYMVNKNRKFIQYKGPREYSDLLNFANYHSLQDEL